MGYDFRFFTLAKDQVNARRICLTTGLATGHGVQNAVNTTIGDNSVADNTTARAAAHCQMPAARSGIVLPANARDRTIAKKAAAPADGGESYLDGVYARTNLNGGDTSRADGRRLPIGCDVFVVSDYGHEERCAKSELRSRLQTYFASRVGHFANLSVFLGTWRNEESEPSSFCMDLSRPRIGLLPALEAGRRKWPSRNLPSRGQRHHRRANPGGIGFRKGRSCATPRRGSLQAAGLPGCGVPDFTP